MSAIACGGLGDAGEGASASAGGFGGGLSLSPGGAAVFVDTGTEPPAPAVLTYTVTTRAGEVRDVTSEAKLSLANPALGDFNGATFVSAAPLPGGAAVEETRVRAQAGGLHGEANLTVVALRKTGPSRDFFFVVPRGGDPEPARDVLSFATKIRSVDVAFVVDTTESMAAPIGDLRTALASTLLPDLEAAIPSVGLAIVDQKDYPVSPFGEPGDFPVKVRRTVTTSLVDAQAAVAEYAAFGGGDGFESQIPALMHTLTGKELVWPGGSVPAHLPPPGRTGGVDFRPGALPVVVAISDEASHDASLGPYPFSAPSLTDVKAAFAAANAKFVQIATTQAPEPQAAEISDATQSNVPEALLAGPGCPPGYCCTVEGLAPTGSVADLQRDRARRAANGNCRLTFLASNVSGAVVRAIRAISIGTAFDVTAVARDDANGPSGATTFIEKIRAKDEGDPAGGCAARAAIDRDGDGVKDTFPGVPAGGAVCFELVPKRNEHVPADDRAQFFRATIEIVGLQGNVTLDRRSVLFLVPPASPAIR